MTVYIAEMSSVQSGGAFDMFTLAPASLPIKILSISMVFNSGSAHIYRSSGSTSGGTSITPTPLRYNGPAGTAVAKFNVSSVSGTPLYFSVNGSGGNPFKPAESVILGVGSVLVIQGYLNPSQIVGVTAYYDELEIQPGY